MRIEVQPKPDGMQHVNLLFCEEAPDPEDAWVRDGLAGMPAPPKRILQWNREGRDYQVWQYGECVIGEALYYIERYKRVVDRIGSLCRDELDRAASQRGDLNDLIAATAVEFHQQARCTMDATGAITLRVDDEGLRAHMLRRLPEAKPEAH